MELFHIDTQIFSGENCGTEYVHDPDNIRKIPAKNPGCRLTFVRPWEEAPGLKAVTVETGKGDLYFQLVIEEDKEPPKNPKNPDSSINKYYEDYNTLLRPRGEKIDNGIWHAASYSNVSRLKPGEILIYSVCNHSGADWLNQNQKDSYTRAVDKIANKEGFKLLYRSEPFFNWVHYERKYPSLVLIVLEKL